MSTSIQGYVPESDALVNAASLPGTADLPCEMVVEMASVVDDNSALLSFALASQRFNQIIMPILLRRIFSTSRLDKLDDGLIFSYNIPEVAFGFSTLAIHPYSALRYIRLAFFNKGNARNISFAFGGPSELVVSNMTEAILFLKTLPKVPYISIKFENMPVEDSTGRIFPLFAEMCGELCRTGCSSLFLSGDSSILAGNEKDVAQLMDNANAFTNLESFRSDDGLTTTVMQDWAVACLSNTRLSTLDINFGSVAILPRLQLPCLRFVEIGTNLDKTLETNRTGCPVDIILAFLARHPSVTDVALGWRLMLLDSSSLERDTITFPSLRYLAASVGWAAAFLSQKCPQLASLAILGNSRKEDSLTRHQDVLSLVSKHPSISEITFPLKDLNSTSAWLDIPHPRAEASLQNIENLRFTTIGLLSADIVQRVVDSIALFPALRALTLDFRHEMDETVLVDDITRKCASLTSIEFGWDKEYSIRMQPDGTRKAAIAAA